MRGFAVRTALLAAALAGCASPTGVGFEELGRLHGCTPVEGATDERLPARREGEFRQPHWFLDTPDGRAGIWWCEYPDRYGPRDGILVSVRDPSHPWAGCPSFFPSGTSRGGAFDILPRLVDEEYVGAPDLDGFRSIGSDSQGGVPGPQGVAPVGPGIVIDHGGAGAMYYCHAGRWWGYGYH